MTAGSTALAVNTGDRVEVRDRPWRVRAVRQLADAVSAVELTITEENSHGSRLSELLRAVRDETHLVGLRAARDQRRQGPVGSRRLRCDKVCDTAVVGRRRDGESELRDLLRVAVVLLEQGLA
jgi:hypothetical protein